MPGWVAMASPTARPSPLTRLNTPGGTPASCSTSATISAFSGATSEGLSTIVQPAASAGATLHMIWLMGQFHGVIMPHDADRLVHDAGGALHLLERKVLEDLDRLHQVRDAHRGLRGLGQPQRRAHLLRDGLHDVAVALLVDREHLLQQRDALFAGGAGIGLEGAPRGLHRRVDVGGRAHADAGDGFLGGGVDDVQRTRHGGVDPLAVDVELQVLFHAGTPCRGSVRIFSSSAGSRPPCPG